MTDDVRPEVIKATQDILGKYFKKPPLTEKLLRKPPFRFLHDIISAVIRETGFLEGLFTEEELNSDNIKDKDTKLAYLTKLIDAVKLITGANLTVRASKIISGQEASKTNELLQVIGRALDKKTNSSEAIEHYKSSTGKKVKLRNKPSVKDEKKDGSRNAVQGQKYSEKEKSGHEQQRSSSTSRGPSNDFDSRERSKRDKDRGTAKANHGKEKGREGDGRTSMPPAEPVQDKTSVSAQRRRHGSPSGKSKESTASQPEPSKHDSSKTNHLAGNKIEEHSRRKESASRSKRTSQSKDTLNVTSAISDTSAEIKSTSNAEASNALDRTSTTDTRRTGPPENEVNEQAQQEEKLDTLLSNARSATTGDTNESVSTAQQSARPSTSLRPPSARPVSARPAAPRVKTKTEMTINEEIPTALGNISVIVENSDAKDNDDADDMVVMETRATASDTLNGSGAYKIDNELTQEHGHLVAQILETQRELANTEKVDVIPKRTDIAWDTVTKRERELVGKEVDKLRETLQALTRATNPLGKLLDYIQEDVEMMRREHADWKSQSKQLNQQLEVEKTQTKELIEPMKETLKEIEDNMQVQLNRICQTKSQILKNDQKIRRLLNGHI